MVSVAARADARVGVGIYKSEDSVDFQKVGAIDPLGGFPPFFHLLLLVSCFRWSRSMNVSGLTTVDD